MHDSNRRESPSNIEVLCRIGDRVSIAGSSTAEKEDIVRAMREGVWVTVTEIGNDLTVASPPPRKTTVYSAGRGTLSITRSSVQAKRTEEEKKRGNVRLSLKVGKCIWIAREELLERPKKAEVESV
ncbi:hypothetical protein ACYPKM_03265 [Pseudomonas aeruginosa]